MTEWISIKDKLPNKDGSYLTYTDRTPGKHGKITTIMSFRNGNWGGHVFEPTHWMPLPQPPENEG